MAADPAVVTPSFPLTGEPLCLDLVNTIQGTTPPEDLIVDAAALDAWFRVEHDRFHWEGRCTSDDVAAIHRLREAVDQLLAAGTDQAPPSAAIDALNDALHQYRGPELTWTAEGFALTSQQREAQLAGVLHVIAADAVSLLTGPSLALVRRCARPECTTRFVATNPRRRWCSGSGCGNRTRVARSQRRNVRSR